MAKTVVIVGALDTKGEDFRYVKELVEGEGLATLVVDFGVMGPPAFRPDIGREEVVAAAGGDLARIVSGDHKDEAMQTMAAGLAAVVRKLYDEGRVDGIMSMGGSGGTSIATTAMRALPVGVPKLMVSTMGGGDVSAFAGTKDITFMPSIVDVAGFNRISRRIYANAAGAIAGMVRVKAPAAGADKPLITASMFGNTTKAVDHAKGILEAKGYEVLVFHATGTGGRTMEGLITDGFISRLARHHDDGARRRDLRRHPERGPGALHGGLAGRHPRGSGPGLRRHGQLRRHRDRPGEVPRPEPLQVEPQHHAHAHERGGEPLDGRR